MLGAVLSLYVVLNFTDPATIGPGVVLITFFLIYLVCLLAIFGIAKVMLLFTKKMMSRSQRKNTPVYFSRVSSRKMYYASSVLAFVPVTLLAMHAFSGLQLTDILLVAVFTTVALFYVTKR